MFDYKIVEFQGSSPTKYDEFLALIRAEGRSNWRFHSWVSLVHNSGMTTFPALLFEQELPHPDSFKSGSQFTIAGKPRPRGSDVPAVSPDPWIGKKVVLTPEALAEAPAYKEWWSADTTAVVIERGGGHYYIQLFDGVGRRGPVLMSEPAHWRVL